MDYRHVTSATVLIVVYTEKGEHHQRCNPNERRLRRKLLSFPLHQQGVGGRRSGKQFGIELPKREEDPPKMKANGMNLFPFGCILK